MYTSTREIIANRVIFTIFDEAELFVRHLTTFRNFAVLCRWNIDCLKSKARDSLVHLTLSDFYPRTDYDHTYCFISYSNCCKLSLRFQDPGTAHRQVSISEYIDMESIFEDPWADLVQKLNEERKQNGEPPLDLDGSSSMTMVDFEITKISEKKGNVDSDNS